MRSLGTWARAARSRGRGAHSGAEGGRPHRARREEPSGDGGLCAQQVRRPSSRRARQTAPPAPALTAARPGSSGGTHRVSCRARAHPRGRGRSSQPGPNPGGPRRPQHGRPGRGGSGRAAPGRAPQVKLPGSSSETPSRAHLQPRCQRRFSKPLPFTKGEGKERVCRGNSLPITKQRLAICCLERAPAPTARSCVLSDFR